jgi:hypothetical protein
MLIFNLLRSALVRFLREGDDRKRRTLPGRAVSGITAGVLLDDLPANGQPDPAPWILAAPVQPLERLEDAADELLLEADAVILNPNLNC